MELFVFFFDVNETYHDKNKIYFSVFLNGNIIQNTLVWNKKACYHGKLTTYLKFQIGETPILD